MSDTPREDPETTTCTVTSEDLGVDEMILERYGMSSWSCSRPVWDGEECIWHADAADKPDALVAEIRDGDLHGARVAATDLSLVSFPDYTGLVGADLSEAELRQADLSEAELPGADLSRASLVNADLSGADLRRIDFSDVAFTQATRLGRQRRAETGDPLARDWDEIARTYQALKERLSNLGLTGKARRQYLLERRARRLEAKASGGIRGYVAYALSWLSRYVTGYGVDLRAVAGVMLLIFVAPTVVYWNAGFDNSLYYSVVTITTAPPSEPRITDSVTRAFAMAETFLGTLSTVLLGYVLATRESV
jgi:hypothetical protein